MRLLHDGIELTVLDNPGAPTVEQQGNTRDVKKQQSDVAICDRTFAGRVFAIDSGVKDEDTARKKAQSKYKDQGKVKYEKLLDLSRIALVFDNFDDMNNMLQELQNRCDCFRGWDIVRAENRYRNPTYLGWRDIQMNVRIPLENNTSHICEIQLQHEKLYDARENKGAHGHYEKIRNILRSAEQYTDETRGYILEKLRNSAKPGPEYLHPADVLFFSLK